MGACQRGGINRIKYVFSNRLFGIYCKKYLKEEYTRMYVHYVTYLISTSVIDNFWSNLLMATPFSHDDICLSLNSHRLSLTVVHA